MPPASPPASPLPARRRCLASAASVARVGIRSRGMVAQAPASSTRRMRGALTQASAFGGSCSMMQILLLSDRSRVTPSTTNSACLARCHQPCQPTTHRRAAHPSPRQVARSGRRRGCSPTRRATLECMLARFAPPLRCLMYSRLQPASLSAVSGSP